MDHYMSDVDAEQQVWDMDDMYPEISRRMQPYIDDAVETFAGGAVSENEVGRMTSEAVRASGILSDPPRGHNAGTVSDIARTLVLASLLNRYDSPYYDYDYYYPYPVYPPYFFTPFRGRGFRGRGGGRFRGGRR